VALEIHFEMLARPDKQRSCASIWSYASAETMLLNWIPNRRTIICIRSTPTIEAHRSFLGLASPTSRNVSQEPPRWTHSAQRSPSAGGLWSQPTREAKNSCARRLRHLLLTAACISAPSLGGAGSLAAADLSTHAIVHCKALLSEISHTGEFVGSRTATVLRR